MDRFDVIRHEMGPTLDLEGDMAEVGVFRGKTSLVMHTQAPNKILHLYDTFKGIMGSDKSVDMHSDGDFSDTSVEHVKSVLGDSNNIKYHVGMFPGTFQEHDRKFCFVYSDPDTYFGTKSTLEMFAERMTPHGKIMFDDYGWKGCPGVEKAITEFRSSTKLKIQTALNGTQCIISFEDQK